MADIEPPQIREQEPPPPSFWRAVGITFEATFRNWRTCLVLVAVFALLNGVSSALGETLSVDVDPTRASAGELLVVSAAALAGLGTLLVVGVFVYPPTIGALALVGSGAVESDVLETHGIVRRVLDRALEAIGAFVLTGLILLIGPILVGAAAIVVGLAGGAQSAFAAMVFTFALVMVPMIYVFVRLSLAVPVAVREGLGPVASLRRSWDLVGGHWWWVFGIAIVVGIAASIISGVASTIFSLGRAGVYTTTRGGEPNFVLSALGSTVAAAINGSFIGVLTGVVHAVLARRKPPAELPMPAEPAATPPEPPADVPRPEALEPYLPPSEAARPDPREHPPPPVPPGTVPE